MQLNKKNIHAVVFDWGGVFCTPAEPFALRTLQERTNMNVDQIADAVREIYDGYYLGKYTKETFWPLVLAKLNISEDSTCNMETLNSAYLSSYKIFPEMFDVAKRLSEVGYKVSLLSNLTPDMRDIIRERHQVKNYFTPDIYSCDTDVEVLKPSTKIFEITLKKIGIEPNQCLFIDDSRENITGASGFGLQTLLFENSQQCIQELNILL